MTKINVEWINLNFEGDEKLLSAPELRKADKFATQKLRQKYVASQSGLRRCLGQFLDVDPAKIVFELGKCGKPQLSGPAKAHFNLSHSGDFAVCCITAEDTPVGIDTELKMPLEDYIEVGRQVFSKSEMDALCRASARKSIELFYEIWTRKESIIKAIGLGFSYPAKNISVLDSNSFLSRVLVPDFGQWYVAPLQGPEGYSSACASREIFLTTSSNFIQYPLGQAVRRR